MNTRVSPTLRLDEMLTENSMSERRKLQEQMERIGEASG